MKNQLDALMEASALDAILITGPAQHNPAMFYMTGKVHLTNAEFIKLRGKPGVLYCGPMEREEAAKTGYEVHTYSEYPVGEFHRQSGGQPGKAAALRYRKMLTDAGVTGGRVALYGKVEMSSAWSLYKNLQELMPAVELVGEMGEAILFDAMATKDDHEIARIREMGKVTTEIAGNIHDYLSQQQCKDGSLIEPSGKPVRIGDIKARINHMVAEKGAENPEGTIFAQGHDAGVPHSTGNDSDILRIGETIVFDFFPCEAGGGFFYDFTRTWCLGRASDEAEKLFEQVKQVYDQLMSEYRVGVACAQYQRRTCELFEAMGHPTVMTNPSTEDGYVHGIGHGLGLRVHERPSFSSSAIPQEVISPGMVFTVEPGLYYPNKGLGVRLEDSVWVTADGKIEVLAPYPMDLVIPIKGM